MVATFIIGLREGVEAALIVGMIAAYLTRRGRRDTLRQVWLGVGAAVAVSLAVGIGLQLASAALPERGNEIFATVIGAVAIGVVTYMAVWMRQHARGLKAELEGAAGRALERGSAFGLVAMAFFAVLREGFETAVFLVAIFQNSADTGPAALGALLGLLAAVALGYGLYSGGVRLDIGTFFRITGVVLVLVAAGLLVNTLGSAAEADLIGFGQGQALDLSAVVRPGSPLGALLTGVLGLQSYPTVLQTVAWLAYLVPMLIYVAAPRLGRSMARLWSDRRTLLVLPGTAALAVPLLVLAGVFVGRPPAGAAAGEVASVDGPVQDVQVQLSDAGCAPRPATVPAGAVKITIGNSGSSAVTEAELLSGSRVLGEKENLSGGLTGAFTLRLAPGSYTVSCPGAEQPTASLTVTAGAGTAAGSAELTAATDAYRTYVVDQVDQFVTATGVFTAAVRAGDVARAKATYAPARVFYERIEPVAESFGDLDPAIDARINDVADPSQWTGFHPLEQALWERGSLGPDSGPLADGLLANARKLQSLVATTSYQPAELANGSVALLEEVAKNKITGEEDRYSRTDLVNLVANVDGARKAYELLRPVVSVKDPALARTLDQRFAATAAALDAFRDPAGYGGYVDYARVDAAQRRDLATVVDALGEPLSMVAALVV